MTKVVKFGGSSLADAKQFKKVIDIIKADSDRRYIIPSAPGKRFDEDTKVTDMFIKLYELASKGKNLDSQISKIKERYNEIIEGLKIKNFSLDEEFNAIKTELEYNPTCDYAASRGEYLNGLVMAKYLGYEFIDPKDIIFKRPRPIAEHESCL